MPGVKPEEFCSSKFQKNGALNWDFYMGNYKTSEVLQRMLCAGCLVGLWNGRTLAPAEFTSWRKRNSLCSHHTQVHHTSQCLQGPFISFAEYGEWTVFFSPTNPGLPALREGTLKPLLLHRYISNEPYKAFFCVLNLHFSEWYILSCHCEDVRLLKQSLCQNYNGTVKWYFVTK